MLDQIDHEKDEKMHHFEAMKSSNVHFTFFRMGKILEGLLAGSVEAEVPHGVECLRDAKHIWERLGGVEDQLKQGSFNSMLHAIEDLGHIIHDIANELEECKATVGTDLDKLREMSKAFTDPWYFIFHVEHDLIVNGQDVHHEIMDAMAQWENQHFYEYGHSVGLALSKIFLGGQMKNEIPADYIYGEHYRPTIGHHFERHYNGKEKEEKAEHKEKTHHEAPKHVEAPKYRKECEDNDYSCDWSTYMPRSEEHFYHETPIHRAADHYISHEYRDYTTALPVTHETHTYEPIVHEKVVEHVPVHHYSEHYVAPHHTTYYEHHAPAHATYYEHHAPTHAFYDQ